MSTILFDATELAQVAVLCMGDTASDDGKRKLRHYCEALEGYSRANARAYTARYDEFQHGYSFADITAETKRFQSQSPEMLHHAVSTAGLLRYNLDDEADVDALEACVIVLSSHVFQYHVVREREREERAYQNVG